MKSIISTLILFCLLPQFSTAQDIAIQGSLWVDEGSNFMDDGELGPSDVKIYLIDADTDIITDFTLTTFGEFNFPSEIDSIIPGNYYLEVAIEEFDIGGTLQDFSLCPGSNDANDGVDSDDNGSDYLPLQTTPFVLDSGLVEYVDFCLYFDCNEPVPFAVESCDAVTDDIIFCSVLELENICGLMSTENSPGNQPLPLCPDGGAAHNISWFAFIADAGNYSVTVTPTGCTGSTTGNEGVQMGLYTDCTFQESIYCNPACSTDPVTFNSDGSGIGQSSPLVPGQTYYFFIDGCSGSVCSYEVSISGTPTPPTVEVDELCILDQDTLICDDASYCLDQEIIFQTSSTPNYNADYEWEITTLSGGPYTGDPTPYTEENNIELVFDIEGIYSICLTTVGFSCPGLTWTGQKCRMVTIEGSNVPDESFSPISLCEDELANFDIGIVGEEDPNGDGIMGWQDTSFIFGFGSNISTVTDANGCSYQQEIELIQLDNPQINLNLSADSLCLGDSLVFSISINSDYDSILWTINDVPQSDSVGVLFPEVGEYNFVATIYNSCGTDVDEVLIQVLDTVSVPLVECDTTTIGQIVLSWPIIEGVEGYWLTINDDSPIILTDSFYVVEDLASGEEIQVEFNLLDSTKCVGPSQVFLCVAQTIVNVHELQENYINVIPNPTYDNLTIDGDLAENSSYQIYSIEGKICATGKIEDSQKVDVTFLSSGLYILVITDHKGANKKIGRFVKNE